MKRPVLFLVFVFLFISSTFSQNTPKPNYDSLWYFHPFSIDVLAGVWTPIGKLSESFKPSAQFGGSLGIMVSKRMRFQLWIMPRLLNEKKALAIKVNDSIVNEHTTTGASLGGWLSYTFNQNKHISAEVLTGITWEDISTDIKNPNSRNKKDSLLSVSGLGLSVGLNTWINTFPRLNFGLRAIYTYATYNSSKNLAGSIGEHSMTFSLVYRFPRRNQDFKRWY